MLLCALTLSLAVAQPKVPLLDEKVTFTNPGLAVPRMMEELSKSSHVPLLAPKAFQSDILVIRVRDVKLGDLLAKIGDLTAADWKAKGDGFELVRSRTKQRAEEQVEYDREVEIFQKAIDKQKKNTASLEPWTEQSARGVAIALADAQKVQVGGNGRFDNSVWRRIQDLDGKAPGGRAISRVLAALDAKLLASLPIDYKTVFSDQPTNMQRPLPKAVIGGLQQLVAEQNMWADVASKVIGDPQGGFYSAASWMKKPFNGQMGKVLVMVSKSKAMGNFSANIEIAACDRKGVIVVRGNQNLNTGPNEEFKPPAPEPGEKELPQNRLSEAAKDLFDRSNGTRTVSKMPKDLVDILLDPEHSEPLALGIGEILISVSEAKNENLVADVTDECFIMGAFASIQKLTPSSMLKTLGLVGIKTEEKDGWLVMTPQAPASARAERLDRALIGRYVRAVARDGRASLDEQAAYVTGFSGEIYNTIGYAISMLISGRQRNEYYESSILRFYGLLDSNQRQALLKGAKVGLGSLTAAQFEVVNKMVFGSNPNLSLAQPANSATSEDSWEEFYNGIGREPTEMFPNGIPRTSIVSQDGRSDYVLISAPYQAGEAMMDGRAMSSDEVAQNLYAKERPGIFPWIDSDTGWDQRRFWYGARRTLIFNFDFGGLATMSKQLQDTNSQKSDAVPYSQVPAEFRDEVEKRLVEMRKQYANVKPGELGSGPGTSNPPPPPRR